MIELLPQSRWGELETALRESRSDETLPTGNAIMLGATLGDKLIGCIGAERVWVVSPFWVAREHRGNGLAEELANSLARYNTEGLREMCATTSPHVERLVFSLGFVPIQGQMWRREVQVGQQVR